MSLKSFLQKYPSPISFLKQTLFPKKEEEFDDYAFSRKMAALKPKEKKTVKSFFQKYPDPVIFFKKQIKPAMPYMREELDRTVKEMLFVPKKLREPAKKVRKLLMPTYKERVARLKEEGMNEMEARERALGEEGFERMPFGGAKISGVARRTIKPLAKKGIKSLTEILKGEFKRIPKEKLRIGDFVKIDRPTADFPKVEFGIIKKIKKEGVNLNDINKKHSIKITY